MLAILVAQLLSNFSEIELDEVGVIDHPLRGWRCGVTQAHAFHQVVARRIHLGLESIQRPLELSRSDFDSFRYRRSRGSLLLWRATRGKEDRASTSGLQRLNGLRQVLNQGPAEN